MAVVICVGTHLCAQESNHPWADLFHTDSERRSSAIQRAKTENLAFPQIVESAPELSSSRPEVRQALAELMVDRRGQTDQQVVFHLLTSQQPELRRLGLVAARSTPSDSKVLLQIQSMATGDPDSVTLAQARLFTAEMPGFPASAELQSSPVLSMQTAPREVLYPSGARPIPDSEHSVPEAAPLGVAFFPEGVKSRRGKVAAEIEQSNGSVAHNVVYDRKVVTLSEADLHAGDDASGVVLVDASVVNSAHRAVTAKQIGSGLASIASPRLVSEDQLISPTPRERSTIRLPDLPFAVDESTALVPPVLERPFAIPPDEILQSEDAGFANMLLAYPVEAPLGYTGPSGILSEDVQEDSHFVPMPDRWRSGFSEWDRYNRGHPHDDDYPYALGSKLDPYRQNVLKGDYPFLGQNTFFRFTGTALTVQEYRQLPVATSPFESTVNPNQEEFFGDPNQYFTTNYFKASFEVFHGSAAFKPVDWAIRLTPIFNINYLNVQELGIVNPNVRNGTTRYDDFMALEEYFFEAKLADLSPDYDFVSMRIGSQPFTSDFRGFIFSDINRGVRLFGTRLANRDEFNVIFFDQVEKDTNSQLNTFDDRHQNTLIANYYRQDFIFPGYTAEISMHYNRDGPSTKYDTNGILVRPDPAGVALPHQVDACYLGFAGEGHIGRVNVANAFYWVVGRDTMNPIAGQKQDINAQMAALELSYDRDWVRFRASYFYASGDDNAYDRQANGFDAIFDNPNFAGGEFSFWQRQQIQLFGVSLVNRFSLVPDLRSSKFQGQSNFVNPGLNLFNLGMDFELTPKLRLLTNANYLQFDNTAVLEAFTFQSGIDKTIGVDLSAGLEYRPFLNDNVVLEGGYAALLTGRGFDDLYGKTSPFTTQNAPNYKASTLHQAFVQMALVY